MEKKTLAKLYRDIATTWTCAELFRKCLLIKLQQEFEYILFKHKQETNIVESTEEKMIEFLAELFNVKLLKDSHIKQIIGDMVKLNNNRAVELIYVLLSNIVFDTTPKELCAAAAQHLLILCSSEIILNSSQNLIATLLQKLK